MDTAGSVGGTWAEERLYPGLKTNNIVGSYEFSDFPLEPKVYGLQPGQHIPGTVVYHYLRDFAVHFNISPLIRFHTTVKRARLLQDGTWLVTYNSTETLSVAQEKDLIARKIAIATGLTSEPHVPVFPGQSKFEGSIFHPRALQVRAKDLASSRNVVVVGGNKSAWDVCYSAARSGAKVTMLIRPLGGGPSWVWRPYLGLGLGRFSISRLSSTRLCSWFDPSPFGHSYQGARDFLHFTWVGQMLSWLFWSVLDYLACVSLGYNDECLAVLRPWSSTFWMGNSLSIHNYETDWFDYIRNGVITVEHAEIVSMDERWTYLSTGKAIEADTVVTCTGWRDATTITFEPPEVAAELGLPASVGSGFQRKQNDSHLVAEARKQVISRSPELSPRPLRNMTPSWRYTQTDSKLEPNQNKSGARDDDYFRLYRSIVPASERILQYRNLAFVGMHHSIHTVMVAQAQALWATAFFQDRIPDLGSHGGMDQVKYQAYLLTEYERMRRPKEGAGADGKYLDLVFDTIPYIDSLLEDIGVQTRRKSSWWRDISEPYTLRNYEGIVKEWLVSGSGST
ncbi:hypothetical protein N0V82_007317 [Gnomoniopsis sp. IMI 355080]|nr:hypothetical protein N0V82_007317 [Gnomoniopsis sp. IMI 355080]